LNDIFGNCDPSARWTFFDPAPLRFAAKTKLALRAQTVVFAGAKAAGAGRPEKSPMRALRDPIFKLRKPDLSLLLPFP
jgi:hypothetical protein